jgi:hypothetical protein
MSRLVRFRFGHPIKPLRLSKSALITAALLTLLFVMPMRVLAQGSPFDTGFNATWSACRAHLPPDLNERAEQNRT